LFLSIHPINVYSLHLFCKSSFTTAAVGVLSDNFDFLFLKIPVEPKQIFFYLYIVVMQLRQPLRALSSAGSERTPHTRKVAGSIPAAPTERK
jgi:hypothetical protein